MITADSLRLTIVQPKLIWDDISGNLERLEQLLLNTSATDLIILPEMFSTGFSMNTALAQSMDGEAVNWMRKIAQEKRCVVTGSLMVETDGKFFNRLIWMRPNGGFELYDKRHLFSLSKEPSLFTRGKAQLLVEVNGWKVLPVVCYDLRFPVWCRNTMGYDLMICVANWPNQRSFAWKNLLYARAIENQAYVVGVNVVGEGNGTYYSGNSAIIDPFGHTLFENSDEEVVHHHYISYSLLIKMRSDFPFLNDRDNFEIKP